jgi:hypothetical protein
LPKNQLSKEQRRALKAAKRLEKSRVEIPQRVTLPTAPVASSDALSETIVLCVRYGNKYGRDYVERLRNMVARNLTLSYDFYCLTDDQHPIEGVKSLYQPSAGYSKLWWHKVHMFDGRLPIKGRILFFDLDVIIHKNIDKLISNYKNEFLGIRDFNRKFYPGWQYLNSSVMSWTHGTQNHIFDQFIKDKNAAMRMQGDQDWIWKTSKNRMTFWPEDWIQSYKWETRSRNDLAVINGKRNFKTVSNITPHDSCSVSVFHGDPKPSDIQDPFVIQHWQ